VFSTCREVLSRARGFFPLVGQGSGDEEEGRDEDLQREQSLERIEK